MDPERLNPSAFIFLSPAPAAAARCFLRPSPLHCRRHSPPPSSTAAGFPFSPPSRPRSPLHRLAPASPPWQSALRSACLLGVHGSVSLLSQSLLSLGRPTSFPGGDDWASGGAIRSSSGPLPATSTRQVCPPLLFPSCCVKRSTPNLIRSISYLYSDLTQLQYITY